MKKRMKSVSHTLAMVLLAAIVMPGSLMAGEDDEKDRPALSERRGSDDLRETRRGGHRRMKEKLPRGQWWRMPGVAKKLGINAEEQKELDALYMSHRREIITLKGDVEKEKLELEFLLDKKTIDEQAIKTQFAKLHDARGKMSNARFTFLLEVRKILGYERYQQLKSDFQQRRIMRERKPMRDDRGERRPMREDRGGTYRQ